ncbi:7314_t:CDS:2, partial [Acaulospora morrowiae]
MSVFIKRLNIVSSLSSVEYANIKNINKLTGRVKSFYFKREYLTSSNKDEGILVEQNEEDCRIKKRLSNKKREHIRYLARMEFWKNNYETPNFHLLKEFPLWLKGHNLIKFTSCFEGMKIRDAIAMDENQLAQIGIHRNAARKILVDAFGKINKCLDDPSSSHRIDNIDEVLDTVIK